MINLHIEVETVEEFFDTLQKLLAGTAMPSPAPVAEKPDNVVPMTPKKGKNKTSAVGQQGVADAASTETVDSNAASQETVDKLAENLEPETDAGDEDFSETTAEPEAPKVTLTQANTRKFAIRFVNACEAGDATKDPSIQAKRKEEFTKLLKVFGVAKFTEIPAEQWPAVVEYVNSERVKRKLPADEVKETDVD